jgi:hypothetical protein
MFGDKIGVYSASCVLELGLRVSVPVWECGKGCAPLLDLKNEIVVGTVTSVVIVRMKKGKNCPCTGLETVVCSKEVGTHLFIVVVVGSRHCDGRGSSRGPLTVCLVSDERKDQSV